MCGIVGLFLKEKRLYPKLGDLLSDMLITLSDRGPDSTGIAVYSAPSKGKIKLTVQSPKAKSDFSSLVAALKNGGIKASLETKNSHAVIKTGAKAKTIREFLAVNYPDIRVMGVGERVEIYKEVGLPKEVVGRFGIRGMSGSHAIGHTRMATESAVTTLGAHPFSTGDDQCLVHNGSLSNHNNLRRRLVREGMSFETYNDTEVAAAYLTAEMAKGKNLGDALKGALDALDGFSRLSSAQSQASAWCATQSLASPQSWPKPVNTLPSARSIVPSSRFRTLRRHGSGSRSRRLSISGIRRKRRDCRFTVHQFGNPADANL